MACLYVTEGRRIQEKIRLLANYDSQPPSEAQKSDWSLVTSVGYTF